jgi:RHH-type proline utilization regulon transcriptional repressor/proline dehydrogenase/delta 1-pyrroline-5-carboxylate dehydrogenase
LADLAALREALRRQLHADEKIVVTELLAAVSQDAADRQALLHNAIALVERCRARSDEAGTLDAFLQEFGLSNREGIALMCLAEALLRVPDEATADRLIAEKIHSGDWGAHKGKSASAFVNASVWGLMLTGRVLRLDDAVTRDTDGWVRRLVAHLGEPVVRQAVLQAMRIMGGQYVLGRNIEEGLRRGVADNPRGTRFSFDMLGEGARTAEDAGRYFQDYLSAIKAIGRRRQSAGELRVEQADGISVKLSALHPRYSFRQKRRVMVELLPLLTALARECKLLDIGLNIDAEECARLDLSMDLFQALATDPELGNWDGLGFVLQAYQKRAPAVARWLVALAQQQKRRFMVRLVKGAYWDSEIKHAQEQGVADYPVYTRKCHTDLCYEVCAGILLSAPEQIYPQFATHNAHTVATVLGLAGQGQAFEFQRLHGMGQLLYDELRAQRPDIPLRVYAPIGSHRDLLPYLVRRLLENGANSSFVNRFMDATVPADRLIRDPVAATLAQPVYRHPQIPRPQSLYLDEPRPWLNARGRDLDDPLEVARLLERMAAAPVNCKAEPLVDGRRWPGVALSLHNPARTAEIVGQVVNADPAAIEAALAAGAAAQADWDRCGVSQRAECLDRAAALLEAHAEELMATIVAEGGRTVEDALSELREAVDFCRYYATQARAVFADQVLPGPTGESNVLSLHGRGLFLCVSPWNFPLAIFVGQVAAALVAGNSVIAKPAAQTPLVAARAVELLHDAGVPGDVLQLLPGGPEVGGALVEDPRIAGVAFTGSTHTARRIQQALAAREGPIAPLIAETGGLNVMLVDATALPEQVVDDVIMSAFQSAGQRCSALRVLFLQRDVADGILRMLSGAMQELVLGDPAALSTDIGPVIDAEAREKLEQHVARMDREAALLATCETPEAADGYFFAPRIYEIERLDQLPEEVFGPILHVIRYPASGLDDVLQQVNASGYGLTLGVHSRIDGFAQDVFRRTRVGNTYINRNMVGAVVGVNPFGGQGLSGTGPKAGGPHYLLRFASEKTRTENVTARGGNTDLFTLQDD